MPFAFVRHRVSNFEVWRAFFDGDSLRQREAGVLSRRVYQAAEDRYDVTVVLEVESRDRFREFLDDPSVKEFFAKAGLVSPPEVSFWEDRGGMDLRGLKRRRPSKKRTSKRPARRSAPPRGGTTRKAPVRAKKARPKAGARKKVAQKKR